jgi:chromosome segregation ATPase
MSKAVPRDERLFPTLSAIVLEKRLVAVQAQIVEEQAKHEKVSGQLEFAAIEVARLERQCAAMEAAHAKVSAALATAMSEKAALTDMLEAARKDIHEHGQQRHALEAQLHAAQAHTRTVEDRLLSQASESMALQEKATALYVAQNRFKEEVEAAHAAYAREKEQCDELSIRWQQTIQRVQTQTLLKEKAEQKIDCLRVQVKVSARSWIVSSKTTLFIVKMLSLFSLI